MAVLVKWRAADNVNTAWTDVTTDGTATYTGTPKRKVFGGKAATNFNELGHYYTGGYAGAVGQRYIAIAEVSDVSSTDVLPLQLRTDDAITFSGSSRFYITENTVLSPDGNSCGTITAATKHQYELRIEAGGTLAVYLDNVLKFTGEAGNAWHTRTIRAGCNMARVNGTSGSLKWDEFYITDSNGFTPPTPTSLAVSAEGVGSITVTWTDVATSTEADGISVEYRSGSDPFGEFGTVAIGTQTCTLSPGLIQGAHYDIRVRAYLTVNGVKQYGSYSSTVEGTSQFDPPTGLSATAINATRVDLTWTSNSSTREDGFEIYRSNTSGSGFVLIDTVSTGVEAYSDTAAPSGRTLYYKVRAFQDYDPPSVYSTYTSEASATTPARRATGSTARQLIAQGRG